jgi:hypothetical protein
VAPVLAGSPVFTKEALAEILIGPPVRTMTCYGLLLRHHRLSCSCHRAHMACTRATFITPRPSSCLGCVGEHAHLRLLPLTTWSWPLPLSPCQRTLEWVAAQLCLPSPSPGPGHPPWKPGLGWHAVSGLGASSLWSRGWYGGYMPWGLHTGHVHQNVLAGALLPLIGLGFNGSMQSKVWMPVETCHSTVQW